MSRMWQALLLARALQTLALKEAPAGTKGFKQPWARAPVEQSAPHQSLKNAPAGTDTSKTPGRGAWVEKVFGKTPALYDFDAMRSNALQGALQSQKLGGAGAEVKGSPGETEEDTKYLTPRKSAQFKKFAANWARAFQGKQGEEQNMCKSERSQCCSNEDCPVGHYCFDTGKAMAGKWTGIGGCSPHLSHCCEDGDADPINRDTSTCPLSAKCSAYEEIETKHAKITKTEFLEQSKASKADKQVSNPVVRNYKACKDAGAQCCRHSDCGADEYCYDLGKSTSGTATHYGACSKSLKSCCAGGAADSIDGKPSACPAASKCFQDTAWLMVQKVRACKSEQSQCCDHSDCKADQYCYDTGKIAEGNWNGIGACSSNLKECCETVEPLGGRTSHCPVGSMCTQNSNWFLHHGLNPPEAGLTL